MKKDDLYIVLDLTQKTIEKITKEMLKEKYTNNTDIANMIAISYNVNEIKRHYKQVKKK